MRRLALLTATALATAAVVLALWELRTALALFLLAIATSAAVQPLVDLFTGRGLPHRVAVGLAWMLGLALPALLLLSLAGAFVVDDLQGAADALLPRYEEGRARWAAGNPVERLIAERLPSAGEAARLRATKLSEVARPALGLGVGLFSTLGELVIVAIMSMFWAANRDEFERLWLSLVPVHRRPFAQETWQAILRGVGERIRADLAEGLLTSALLYAGFAAMGLDYPILPAIAGGLFRLIPLVGWLLALLATLVVGLATGPGVALLATAHAVVVLLAVEILVAPRLLRARRYSALLLTLVVVAMADVHALFGLLVAPSIAAALQILFERFVTSFEPSAARIPPTWAGLAERVAALDELMATPTVAGAPELLSVVGRLKALMVAAEEATREETAAGAGPGDEVTVAVVQ